MKTIQIKVTDEEYDVYSYYKKYSNYNGDKFDKNIFYNGLYNGEWYDTYDWTINLIKTVVMVFINNDNDLAYSLKINSLVAGGTFQDITFRNGVLTKPAIQRLKDFLKDIENIELVEIYNKYHPDDKININEFKNNNTENKNN